MEVPIKDPASSRIIAQPDVSPADGCHDMSLMLDRRTDPPRLLAGAACITESQVWDISDPVDPQILAHIVNPQINIHHSAAFNWEGDTLVLGDELGGAALAPGCFDDDAALGALWFYDVTDPRNPQVKGNFVIPHRESALTTPAPRTTTTWCPCRMGGTCSSPHGTSAVRRWSTSPTRPTRSRSPSTCHTRGVRGSRGRRTGTTVSSTPTTLSTGGASRGLDVFTVEDLAVDAAVQVPWLNPQTQERPAGVAD